MMACCCRLIQPEKSRRKKVSGGGSGSMAGSLTQVHVGSKVAYRRVGRVEVPLRFLGEVVNGHSEV
jgi:hypothetical protein